MSARSALVTGASRGIGRAIAERFSVAGFHVLSPARAELDLSSTDSIIAFTDRIRHTAIDVLVNCGGENRVDPLATIQLADWQRILTTNLTAAFLLIQQLAPGMAERGWGRVVNISSCYSFLGRAGRAAYSASKSGLNGLTRTAAVEFGSRNVLINAVAPGFVESEMTSRNNSPAQIAALAGQTILGRLGTPSEVAELVYFLGSETNTYLTGQTLVIDGGFSCQ